MSPSNEQEGSLIKCLRERNCLFDSLWEISNIPFPTSRYEWLVSKIAKEPATKVDQPTQIASQLVISYATLVFNRKYFLKNKIFINFGVKSACNEILKFQKKTMLKGK